MTEQQAPYTTKRQSLETCPFCGQEVLVLPGFDEPVFACHEKDGEPCRGWGKSVAKSEELRDAVRDMLEVILKQYPELLQEEAQ